MYVHAHTLYSAIRPFGTSIMLGSYEEGKPQLYTIDPSGVSLVSVSFLFFDIYFLGDLFGAYLSVVPICPGDSTMLNMQLRFPIPTCLL
jgi:hypothetical protein